MIVAYKTYPDLENCVASLFSDRDGAKFFGKVVIVDNAPDSAYWSSRPAIYRDCLVLKNHVNVGFARAVNQAVRAYCRSKYLLILNPDTIVHHGMVSGCIAFMESRPDVGILGPKILNGDGTIQGSARRFPSPSTLLFGRSSPLTRLFPGNRWVSRNMPALERKRSSDEVVVDWVSGAASVIRRTAFRQVGYFDERFFLYWEDADLCQRLAASGWKVVYFPLFRVTHFVGKSSAHDFFRSRVNFYKSAFLLEKKQSRNTGAGHMALVVAALAFHFVLSTVWRFMRIKGLRGRASNLKARR